MAERQARRWQKQGAIWQQRQKLPVPWQRKKEAMLTIQECSTPHREMSCKVALCRKCNSRGHYTSNCCATTVLEISHNEEVHTMTSNQEYSWRISITLDGKDVPFKIDTGAEVTAISHVTYLQVGAGRTEWPREDFVWPFLPTPSCNRAI